MKNREITPSWSQEMRLQFIDHQLKWDGKLNRQDIQDAFGISKPQSSLDLALYQKKYPKNIEYDKSSKFYTYTKSFKDAFPESSAANYLNEILMLTHSKNEFKDGIHSQNYIPPVELAFAPEKKINDSNVRGIVLALRFNKSLIIEYQSISNSSLSTRTITPTSLCFDGNRWHVRAYCHSNKRYSDFAISKIKSIIKEITLPKIEINDDEWNEFVTVALNTKSNLNQFPTNAVCEEYSTNNNEMIFTCRKAMLFYSLRKLNLLSCEGSTNLEIVNRHEIKKHLESMGINGVL